VINGIGARGRARGLRIFALAFAILQLGLQGAFAVSDGIEEQASSHTIPVHAEVPGNTHHRLHSDDCAICHVLASAADVPARATASWHVNFRLPAVPTAAAAVRALAINDGVRLPRAPPLTV